MRVTILNQTFHPDVAATAQHMWDLARFLVDRGHRVTAVAGDAVYGSTRRLEAGHSTVDGVDVRRVRQTAFGKRNIAGRVADFASFYVAAHAALRELPPADVVLALTSPPMIALLAVWQRQLARTGDDRPVAFVHHLMDLYPDAAIAMDVMRPTSALARATGRLTRLTLDRADGIVYLGDDMAELVARRYGVRVDDPRVSIVTPWADGRELTPLSPDANPLRRELGLAGTFNVVYSGNLGMAHDAETMADAVDATAHDHGLRWVFIGDGRRMNGMRDRAERSGWPHARFLPYQPREQLNWSLNLADVHLTSQLPAFTGIVVPSKLFGAMAVGKPSIMVGPADAEVSRVLTRNDAGLVVPVGDAAGLVAAVRRLRHDAAMRQRMGENARAAFERDHDRDVCCGRIERVLTDAVRRRREHG